MPPEIPSNQKVSQEVGDIEAFYTAISFLCRHSASVFCMKGRYGGGMGCHCCSASVPAAEVVTEAERQGRDAA